MKLRYPRTLKEEIRGKEHIAKELYSSLMIR